MNHVFVIEKRKPVKNSKQEINMMLMEILHIASNLDDAVKWIREHCQLDPEIKVMQDCLYFCFLAKVDSQIDEDIEENNYFFDEYGNQLD